MSAIKKVHPHSGGLCSCKNCCHSAGEESFPLLCVNPRISIKMHRAASEIEQEGKCREISNISVESGPFHWYSCPLHRLLS